MIYIYIHEMWYNDVIVFVYRKSPDYCVNVVNGTNHDVFRHIRMAFSTYRSCVIVCVIGVKVSVTVCVINESSEALF